MGFMDMVDSVIQELNEEEAQADVLKAVDRVLENATTLPAPPTEEQQIRDFTMPEDYRLKNGTRGQLIFEGVCTHCGHCGQPLSDAVSIQRGIGPVCSKKGYLEDPENPDEVQAMIDLAEFPALVQYLTQKWTHDDKGKPLGVRGLMNGLVRICSLNRRSPVHQACTDAIESIGYRNLAAVLRESISVVDIKDHEAVRPGYYLVFVKKADWTWAWTNALRGVPGSFPSRYPHKGTCVPKTQKKALWNLMLTHYNGLYAKTPTGAIKIRKKTIDAQTTDAPSSTPDATSTLT